MYILHIETSTAVCSVALSYNDTVVTFQDLEEGMNHTAMLAPAIDQLLKSSAIHPADLAAVSVSSGPGSYTGLRVGSSTAKAMAYSLGKPVLAVPTLKALAKVALDLHPDAKYALPMLDARRMEVYTGLYDRDLSEIWPVSSALLDENFFNGVLSLQDQVVSCGDGSLKTKDLAFLPVNYIVEAQIQCSARHLVGLALELYSQQSFQNPLHFVPYYLKPPNITVSKKDGMGGLSS